MEAETIELKVEVTGLDEAQKKISDFMNSPDVKRYEALMGLSHVRQSLTGEIIAEDEQKDLTKAVSDLLHGEAVRIKIPDLPSIKKRADIEHKMGMPCVTLYGLSHDEIYKILDELGLNNGC